MTDPFNPIDFISDYQKLLLYIEFSNNDYKLPQYLETQNTSNYDRLFIINPIADIDINLLKQDLKTTFKQDSILKITSNNKIEF